MAFIAGLIFGEFLFGEAYYWKEFCVSNWVGLDNKNGLQHQENSLKQLTITVYGFIFGRAYYRKDFSVSDLGGLFLGGFNIGILR